MANLSSSSSSSGIGFFGLLTLIFVVLKLLGITAVSHWSWWWILAPIWGPLAIALLIFGGIVLFAANSKRS